jgi:hypothetical protein
VKAWPRIFASRFGPHAPNLCAPEAFKVTGRSLGRRGWLQRSQQASDCENGILRTLQHIHPNRKATDAASSDWIDCPGTCFHKIRWLQSCEHVLPMGVHGYLSACRTGQSCFVSRPGSRRLQQNTASAACVADGSRPSGLTCHCFLRLGELVSR